LVEQSSHPTATIVGRKFAPSPRFGTRETPVTARPFLPASSRLILAGAVAFSAPVRAGDVLKELQAANVANAEDKGGRPYHFGSQGPGGVFSNHTNHTNRLIPVYVFGRKADLDSVTGKNSAYRDPEKLKALYGFLPERTLNPEAEYADQSDLYRVQAEAVAKGAKYLFVVWFDGLDWPTTQAAAIAKTGKVYTEGKGSGLILQDYAAGGSAQYGYFVTSPTSDKNSPDVDAQTVTIDPKGHRGGYDPQIAGPNPWTPGPLAARAPGYLKGQLAEKAEKAAVASVGGVLHAYTDSAPSAAEFASGHKSYNNGINVDDDGSFVPTLFNRLQGQGWKVGTVTSVAFDHASPAAMYAHTVHRDDYQDLGRDMLGLAHVGFERKKEERHPGLDVVIGAGSGQETDSKALKAQGRNVVKGNRYLADADKAAVDVHNGGRYVVAQTEPGVDGGRALRHAAARAAEKGYRLLGLFGSEDLEHLPYRTADGRYDPAPDLDGKAESYTPADRNEQPTLADMTEAALAVLGAKPGRPFALFVEAGDVDFALHNNNLDNAVGAVYSGEDAVKVIIDWVEKNSNWDESVMIVTADHGHYLVLDDPKALAATK
jgi:alkaline phosphatase